MNFGSISAEQCLKANLTTNYVASFPSKHEESIINYQVVVEPFCPELILDICRVGSFRVDRGGTLLD